MKKCLFIIFLLLTHLSLSFAQSAGNNTLAEAKAYYAAMNEDAALAKFLEVLKQEPDNYEATWNASLLYTRVGNRFSDMAEKKRYFLLAKQYALAALHLDSNNAESNYVMAVALGRMALIASAREKVAATRSIKRYAEKAIEINPRHAGAWYVMGKWNYEVANLNFAERTVASLLFGGIPQGSMNEAVKDYLKSIQCDGDFIIAYADLARTLNEQGFHDQAVKVLTQVITLPPKIQDDIRYLANCKAMLAKLQQH